MQSRWLGPEKGVTHMATGALVNAVWDLRAKRAGMRERQAELAERGLPGYTTSVARSRTTCGGHG